MSTSKFNHEYNSYTFTLEFVLHPDYRVHDLIDPISLGISEFCAPEDQSGVVTLYSPISRQSLWSPSEGVSLGEVEQLVYTLATIPPGSAMCKEDDIVMLLMHSTGDKLSALNTLTQTRAVTIEDGIPTVPIFLLNWDYKANGSVYVVPFLGERAHLAAKIGKSKSYLEM